MDNQVLGYKDLAAIPKDKAILDIERPDLMIYEPHFTYSLLEHVELPRSREVRGGRFLLDRTGGKGSPSHTGWQAEPLSCFLSWRPDSRTRKGAVHSDPPVSVCGKQAERPEVGWLPAESRRAMCGRTAQRGSCRSRVGVGRESKFVESAQEH